MLKTFILLVILIGLVGCGRERETSEYLYTQQPHRDVHLNETTTESTNMPFAPVTSGFFQDFIDLIERYPSMIAAGDIRSGGTLTVASLHDNHQVGGLLNPLLAQGADLIASQIITPSLLATDHNGNLIFGDNHTGPIIVTPSYNENTITLTMRDDISIHWHDGVVLTLADLYFAYTTIANFTLQNITVGNEEVFFILDTHNIDAFWSRNVDYLPGISLSYDEREISITFSSSIAHAIRDGLWGHPLPRHHFESLTPDEIMQHPVSRDAVIGFGPFELEYISHGEYISLIANINYWQGSPRLETIKIKQASSNTLEAALANNTVDVVIGTNPLPYHIMESLEHITLLGAVRSNIEHLHFNLGGHGTQRQDTVIMPRDDEHPIAHPIVRRAIAYALDAASIINTLGDHLSVPATSAIHPIYGTQYINALSHGLSLFDLNLANDLLDGAGFVRADDGYRFYINIGLPNDDMGLLLYEHLKQNFSEIGIALHLFNGDFMRSNDILSRALFGSSSIQRLPNIANAYNNDDMHMFFSTRELSGHVSNDLLRLFGPNSTQNFGGFQDDNASALLAQLEYSTPGTSDFAELLIQWDHLFNDLVPAIYFRWSIDIIPINNRVRNWSTHNGFYHEQSVQWHLVGIS